MSKTKTPIITLDGPSGTGKGTISHMLAKHLGWHFLDSGALYRVLAFAVRKKGIDFTRIHDIVVEAHALNLRFSADPDQKTQIFLNEQDISAEIRSEQCGQDASKIAVIPEIREALLARQRDFAQLPGLVTDGRDMGTVVFPYADLKLFLYASAQERARRRYLQLKESGNDVSLAQVIDELSKRDARDTERTCAPLKPAEDAVCIDTSTLTVVQVFSIVLQLLNKHSFINIE